MRRRSPSWWLGRSAGRSGGRLRHQGDALAFDLLQGWDRLILVDALPERGSPGRLETIEIGDRLAGYGAQIALLNTGNGFGGECHLDAPMVASALARLDLANLDLLFIENVGNLVCPAEFDVGAHHRVMVYAITEGEEKPLKYPVMFRSVEVVLVNKLDLLPYLDFDLALFRRNLVAVNPSVTMLDVSARTAFGLGAWQDWLAKRR